MNFARLILILFHSCEFLLCEYSQKCSNPSDTKSFLSQHKIFSYYRFSANLLKSCNGRVFLFFFYQSKFLLHLHSTYFPFRFLARHLSNFTPVDAVFTRRSCFGYSVFFPVSTLLTVIKIFITFYIPIKYYFLVILHFLGDGVSTQFHSHI